MFDALVYSFLPDIVDEGIDTVLDRLQGEVGVSGITVPVSTPPLAYLRRDAGVTQRVVRSRGGAFLRTDDARYAQTRVKPIHADWLKGRDPLEQLAARCRARGLDLRIEISATLTGRIAGRHPDAATKSVYADTSPDRLCLLNADVTEFVRALVAEVCARLRPSVVELADFQLGRRDAGIADLHSAGRVPEAAAELLAICFCESCRQTAARVGVHVDAAVRAATALLDTVLTDSHRPPAPRQDHPAPLSDYLAAQCQALDAALTTIVAAAEVPVLCLHYGDESPRPAHAPGASPLIVLPDADHLPLSAQHPAPTTDQFRLPLAGCAAVDPPVLVRALTALAERGVRCVELAHYAAATPADLTVARQAIRFARRSAP